MTNQKNILLIDDDPLIHMSIEMMLFGTNYTKISILDPNEALLYTVNKNNYKTPHLLLVDLMLGATSGIEVIKFIRNDSYFDKIPIILFTGFYEKISQDIQLLESLDVVCVLPKPITKEQLLSRLGACIGT